ncbi:MAG: hypothetical protein A2Y97_13310 [Nitrospirae bacterium RBG_13_39_12]|jgi:hypothetical protein|nr:MAG: hypothetical protein A2Y97_13310 [Nitrospirae bacterium RBG_13_39_12]
MKAYNLRNGKELSNNVTVADSLLKRMKGLLGKKEMLNGEALWIKPCISVHTFFMKFPIEVVFLNKRNQVIATIRNLQPNRITGVYFKSTSVLELPTGVLETTDTRVGDEIEIL